jgi:hypothetical protein
VPFLGGRSNLAEIGYDNWKIFQDDILSKFKKYALPYLGSRPESQHDWLIIAQHHGVPTTLLDWTTNPLKALFFAIEDPSLDDEDGAVWAFEPRTYLEDFTLLPSLLGYDYLRDFLCYFPAHITPRVIAQESCFTFFPLRPSAKPVPPLENIKYYKDEVVKLVKFRIPGESKEMCRHELAKLGISHRSIFPGLDGVAISIRREIEAQW